MRARRVLALGATVSCAFVGSAAVAFEVEDPLHHNCHERLTAAALETVGYRGGGPPPMRDHDDQVFFDHQQFDTSPYDRNLHSLALILGVRSNDVGAVASFDLADRAMLANDDSDQPAHCLRQRGDDGFTGDQAALLRCREFITHEVEEAVQGVTAGGTVDPFAIEEVEVFIPYVGPVRWPLSRFYYHAGRALHALQDTFAHTYRDSDWRRVYAVHNYIDVIAGDFEEERDGHPHETLLDQCDTERPWRRGQLRAAADATEELLALLNTADPDRRDATHAAVVAFLDDWLGYEHGCDLASRYCDNEVHADIVANSLSDGESAGGCSVAAARDTEGPGLPGLLMVLLLAGASALRSRGGRRPDRQQGLRYLEGLQRRGNRRGSDTAGLDTAGLDTAGLDTAGLDTAGLDTAGGDMRRGRSGVGQGSRRSGWLVALAPLLLVLGSARVAVADAQRGPSSMPASAPASGTLGSPAPAGVAPAPAAIRGDDGAAVGRRRGGAAAAPGEEQERGPRGGRRTRSTEGECGCVFPLFGQLRAGASYSDPAFFLAGSAVYQVWRLEVEGGIEWNPWMSMERTETDAGSLNLYALLAWRWRVSPTIDIRTGAGAGLAVLLFETVGTPAGNVGPFFTVRPLGITRRLGRRAAVTVDAFEVAVPMPQTRGWPFSHPQYRVAVGLRL